MRLPDFEAWAIFATVVERRSFTAAADALGLSKATVSKAVTRLEAHVGARLFHRTSRHLSLTETGRALADHAARILAEGTAAEESARDEASAPTGLVRLAAPMTFGLQHVAPVVAEFLAAHPGIAVDLHLSDARIDLVETGYDMALRIAALPDSSLLARRLTPITAHIVAAPAYLERHGRPRHPAELGEHACLCYANLPTPNLWRFVGPDGTEAMVRPDGPLRTNSGDAMLPALRAGLGVAVLPDFIVADDLATGRLEAILPGWSPPPVALHLVTPPGALRPARVEALIAHLLARFGGVRG
ncbi:MAG: LysR family transcriptional regulator [Sphingomonas sp. SCN 67-18]|uniref:LysR family transcriptional regulator n=1 Tax=uncultured Sphingomonas sp. TaxID=158754 RepID=UPI0008685073|nr:LysR family transcriptional regulator [Sphingomonas sp. SCN 67-18]ODU22641.1 MAG: LysR family transcriptional regulator [Sphingomonas sp. SCN 67-18]